MNKNVFVALIAGLLGGLATRYISLPIAFAQNRPSVTREVRAQSFTLVDPSDRTLGIFSAEPVRFGAIVRNPGGANPTIQPQMRIVLRDADGHELWSAGSDVQIRPLSER
jgi:hypothetical protein